MPALWAFFFSTLAGTAPANFLVCMAARVCAFAWQLGALLQYFLAGVRDMRSALVMVG